MHSSKYATLCKSLKKIIFARNKLPLYSNSNYLFALKNYGISERI